MDQPEHNYRVVLPAEIYFDFPSAVPLEPGAVIDLARAALLEIGQESDGFALPALPNARVYRGVIQTLGVVDDPRLYQVLDTPQSEETAS